VLAAAVAAVATRAVASEAAAIVVATVVAVVMATDVVIIVVDVAVAMVAGFVVAVGLQLWLLLLFIRCQFHQHFISSFCAKILLPKNYKPKL
jgi:hypothetical protein